MNRGGWGAGVMVLAALVCFAAAGRAGDWPGWRGPTGVGDTDEKDVPLTWDGKTGQNILWKTPLRGGGPGQTGFGSPGHSCPIVWRNHVFITTAVWPAGATGEAWKTEIPEHHVLCFRASDGRQLWDTVVPPGKCVVDNFYHGDAVPTPVTDGKHVFALFGSGVIAALDLDGKLVWREELPRLKDVDGGICSSPILYEDTVIFPGIADGGWRALGKATGKLKWEQKSRDRNRMSTPALIRIGDRTQLIHYAGGIQSLDPGTGELLWFCRGVTSGQSSPVFGSGLLYTDAGRYGQQGNVVDATGKGDVSKTHVKWTAKATVAAGSSAIIVGPFIYRACDPGLIRCRELATGEILYEERTPGICPGASPIACADGRIYFGSPGKSYVIKAGPKFELLATNDLNDGHYTTPAVSNGRIFIKGKSHLWCIGTKPEK